MTEMAPEQPIPLPLEGFEQGDPINIEVDGSYSTETELFTITWGLPGSMVVTAHYREGEEPLLPSMFQIAQQSWENVHEQILAAIESGQADEEDDSARDANDK